MSPKNERSSINPSGKETGQKRPVQVTLSQRDLDLLNTISEENGELSHPEIIRGMINAFRRMRIMAKLRRPGEPNPHRDIYPFDWNEDFLKEFDHPKETGLIESPQSEMPQRNQQ